MADNEFEIMEMHALAEELGLDYMSDDMIKNRINEVFWKAEGLRMEANDYDWQGILLSLYLKKERGILYDYN